jgi:hypothetical protein
MPLAAKMGSNYLLAPGGTNLLYIPFMPLAAQIPSIYFRAIPIFYNTLEILVFCLPG